MTTPKFGEYTIYQNPSEPSRKFFSDDQNFDLVVWYEDASFVKLTGFQLSFKETPFATHEEYFLTLRPGRGTEATLEIGKSDGGQRLPATAKLIHRTSEPLPRNFHDRIEGMLQQLPPEIRHFMQAGLGPALNAKK